MLTHKASETDNLSSYSSKGKEIFQEKEIHFFLSALSIFMFKEGRFSFNVIIIIIISLGICSYIFLRETILSNGRNEWPL